PGHLVLTPEYASPEQLQAGAITTATDVYQLGVLLYRLLTGRHPYDRGPGASSSLEDVVSDTPPLRPSETLDRPPGAHGAADPVEERARRLGTGVDGLRRRLQGDLDTIILKALRKEPDRRYASVEALADDVRRHLSGRPISARPDTWGYRTRKFLARNRWVLPVAAVLAVVAGGYVLTLVRHSAELERERDLARLEADRAEEVQDFLVGLFRSADPFASPDPDRGTRLSVVEALDLGTERARSELEDRPELRADLLGAISEVFANLDDIERASALRNEALAIEREVHGPRSPEVAASLAALAKTVSYTNEADSARALFRESLALTEEIHGPEHPLVGSILTDRAWLEYRTVSPGEAEPDLARAAELLADAGPDWAVDRIDALSTLSDARREIGDIDGAAAAALEALEVATEHFDTDHVQTLHPRDSYAQALLELGRYDEAVEILRETAELQQRILGEDHLNTIATLNNLARALDRQGNLVESEEIYRRMLAIAVEKWGHDYVATADLKQNLAANLADQERYDDASALLEEAYDTYREVLEPGHYLVAYPLLTRSGLELEQGRYTEARASAREAAGILRNGLPEGHIATAAAECRVGRALAGLGEEA
ncbi:MAG TPA: tetratricopeptide repeat-containing protein kinase family protein, partial [Longimicrobiales bacterium]|nr:tetratricopeptide repeat-containing protein kinase family protein [Longimicrobiales bacterium]